MSDSEGYLPPSSVEETVVQSKAPQKKSLLTQVVGWILVGSGASAILYALFLAIKLGLKGELAISVMFCLVLTVLFGLVEAFIGWMVLRGALWAKAIAGFIKIVQIPSVFTPVFGFSWFSGFHLGAGFFGGQFFPKAGVGGYFNLMFHQGMPWGCGVNLGALLVLVLIIVEYITSRKKA